MSDIIVIDDNLRTMTIPDSVKLLGVESDDSVNKINFNMPRYYNGFDLSTFAIRINYVNAKNEGDVYLVDDTDIGDESLNFTWLVERHACEVKGNVKFIVCLKKTDENDVVIQEFNTTPRSLPVLEGLETSEAVIQEYPDIFEQLVRQVQDGVLNVYVSGTTLVID